MYKNETQENYSNSKIEEPQNLDDSEPDNEDEIHTDDIETFFNMSDEPNDVDNYNSGNIVYLDIQYLGNIGRVIISLNNDVVPKTSNNFYTLCEKKAYKGCKFHRIIKNFIK